MFTVPSQTAAGWLRRHPHKVAGFILVFVLHLCFFPFIWGGGTLLSSARSVASILPRGARAGEVRNLKYQRTLDAAEPGWHSEPMAAVAELRFDGEESTSPLRRVYKDEAQIYEYGDVLPRAAVFHQVLVVANAAEALAKLKDPEVDVLRTVIMEHNDLDIGRKNQIALINGSTDAGPAETARITSYSSQRVAIEASLQEPGVLQLNDANYPGWKVFVDGHASQWIPTDFLFRGVFLPAGHHSVEFRYEPESFRNGLWISAGFLLLAILYGLAPVKKDPKEDTPA